MCRLPTGHTLPMQRIGFPHTKPEARGTAPTRMFTVRHRLLRISLASAPSRIRLRLSWLSFSSPGFGRHQSANLLRVAEAVTPRSRLSPDGNSPRQPRCTNSLFASPHPTDGICTRFACRNRDISAGKRSPNGFASPTRPRPRRGLSASPVFPLQRTTPLDRTPGLLRGGRFFLTTEACDLGITPTSLH